MKYTIIIALLLTTLYSCKDSPDSSVSEQPSKPSIVKLPEVQFNADSAFGFIEKQLSFGPRIPDSKEHQACGNWIESQLAKWHSAEQVSSLIGQAIKFDGTDIGIRNIMLKIAPDNKRRILLGAHWDTRFIADSPLGNQTDPVLGANDGGSGVAVLMELARQLSKKPLTNLGVDIVFFDTEDQGYSRELGGAPKYNPNRSWGLGSQDWAKKHKKFSDQYRYGILLDMVGGKDSYFLKEGFSMAYASRVVNKVWKLAADLGYQQYFRNELGSEIIDDHYFVNQIAGIPMIDIIHTSSKEGGFHHSWHTEYDNINIIDIDQLERVGKVLLTLIEMEDQGLID